MDLGATICTPKKPACALCPWNESCAAHARAAMRRRFRVETPKREGALRRGAAFVARRADGFVLVRTRPAKGLLGGMTEVPTTEWSEDFAKTTRSTARRDFPPQPGRVGSEGSVNTWRPAPGTGATRHPPVGSGEKNGGAPSSASSSENPPTIRSSALRSCRRADLWPAAAAPERSRRRGGRRKRRRGAARLRASAPGAETSPHRRAHGRAGFVPGTQRAGRLFGVQMVAPRSIIAWAKSPARCGGVSSRASRAQLRLGGRQRRLDREEPRDHALDIAVDRTCRRVEGDRGNRRRRIGADAGQARAAPLRSAGNSPPCRSTTARAQACRLRARA